MCFIFPSDVREPGCPHVFHSGNRMFRLLQEPNCSSIPRFKCLCKIIVSIFPDVSHLVTLILFFRINITTAQRISRGIERDIKCRICQRLPKSPRGPEIVGPMARVQDVASAVHNS